ncbi:claudin-5 [Anolis sagrei]|uniref:claudin-5 n=1 Tax=Anolis sagrei TaxID=38937 RepID=UPI00295BBBEF|nr:claudin-5 [Anolis sagrei ordinatus]
MGWAALELLGLALSVLGWAGALLVAALPMWRVSAFLEHNIVVAQSTWEGLWMDCVVQSTGQMQCKVHDSVLALRPEVQAGRTLTVLAALLGLAALLVTVAGARCTTCLKAGRVKARVAGGGGALFAACGLLVLVPPSWFAHLIIRNFYDPAVQASQKREMGAALYLGWAAAALLLLGGSLILAAALRSNPPQAPAFPVKYAAPRRSPSASPTAEYDKKNYV